MRPVVEYAHLRGQPFTISEKEQEERRTWPNCVSFYLRLRNGMYHLSHGPSGQTVEDMRHGVITRIEEYAGTELSWADVLNCLYATMIVADDAFKGAGLRLEDDETKGGRFYVIMQDRRYD
jgi:hypothetical protein